MRELNYRTRNLRLRRAYNDWVEGVEKRGIDHGKLEVSSQTYELWTKIYNEKSFPCDFRHGFFRAVREVMNIALEENFDVEEAAKSIIAEYRRKVSE